MMIDGEVDPLIPASHQHVGSNVAGGFICRLCSLMMAFHEIESKLSVSLPLHTMAEVCSLRGKLPMLGAHAVYL